MLARQVTQFAPIVALVACVFSTTRFESRAADRPNQSTQSDVAVGRMIDSIFDLEQSSNTSDPSPRRVHRRRFSRHTSLQGKLVHNPNQSNGTPPYALVDQYGGVLRYIEPVDHIDLDRFIGNIVGVRRDTGDTLLASQLAFSGFHTEATSPVNGVRLVDHHEEIIAPGEVMEESVIVPSGQEPIYLDEGLHFGGCPDCGSYVGCGSTCRLNQSFRRNRSGVYFDYELTILQSQISNFLSDGNIGFGHRFILGYDGGDGMGARVRYWFYNHGHDSESANLGTLGIDMDVLDLEVTLEEKFRRWDLQLSGGVRFGRSGYTSNSTALFSGTEEEAFQGVGPTVSLEAHRCIGPRGLFLIGNARASLLVGEIDNLRGLPVKTEQEMMTVLESQLGLGYRRDLPRVSFELRALWETQFWLNDTRADSVTGINSNLGFVGPTISAGLQF